MPLKERSGKLLREFININYKVINSQIRYVIKDMETGMIVDDAQGYGDKSAQKAFISFLSGRKRY